MLLAGCGDAEGGSTDSTIASSSSSSVTSSGTGPGAGGSGGSGGEGGSLCDLGEPVTAIDEAWTYIEVAGAACGSAGTTAGFFVNPTARSERLAIFFQGGGACFNEDDCQATFLDGFDWKRS